jgi:cell wall-associated NlpC family hydrolase
MRRNRIVSRGLGASSRSLSRPADNLWGSMSKAGTLGVLAVGALLLSTGCASTGAVPQPFPRPGGPATAARPRPAPPGVTAPGTPEGPVGTSGLVAPAASGYAIAGTALALRGSPYRNGGTDPSGFDCSGFIWYVFAQHGISVPRTVGELFREGVDVSPDALEPGDLLFFSTDAPGASHVGMAIGGDEFVHAPSTRGIVRVERLSSSYWGPRFVGARRVRRP